MYLSIDGIKIKPDRVFNIMGSSAIPNELEFELTNDPFVFYSEEQRDHKIELGSKVYFEGRHVTFNLVVYRIDEYSFQAEEMRTRIYAKSINH